MRSLSFCLLWMIAANAAADIVPEGAKVEKVASGGRFTEGPAADADGNLFYTDSPRNRIMVLKPSGAVEVWKEKTQDANGMRFDAQGRLVACCGEGGARAVVRWEKNGSRTILADRHQGKRLTAPNDLCFDLKGRIYFTDPCYGRKPADGQEKFAVYRIDAENGQPVPNKVTRVIDDVEMPNGICISPDNKTLYVADNAPRKNGPRTLLAYDILADGSCKRRQVLHDFKEARGIDGMECDTDGNIYATAESGAKTGVYIFSPEGKQLGFIRTPETATNCAFGDKDLKTLYITAGASVYKIRVNAVGFLPYPKVRSAPSAKWRDFALPRDLKSAALSADGANIACLVAVVDPMNFGVRHELFVAPTKSGEPRKLAVEAEKIEKILWSPHGNDLALIGSMRLPDDKKAETYLSVIDLAGKTKMRVKLERSSHYLAHQGANLCWSPDGKQLAYLATDAPAPAADGPIVVTRIQYKTRTSFSDNRRTHIWIVDVATSKTRQLTQGRFDEHSIDWSPTGKEIVFCSNREADPDANLNYDLFTVQVKDGAVQQITKTAGSEMSPVFSPDGKSIAYTMTKRPLTTIDSVAEDDHVWVWDGKARELTAALDRRCSQVRWDRNGKSVVFLARDRGKSLIFRAPIAGGEATPLFDVAGMVSSFSFPRAGAHAVCILSTASAPASLCTFGMNGSERNERWRLSDRKGTEPLEIKLKSFDGTPVHGWLMMPLEATAERKVPLVLNVHGGPHGMHGNQYSVVNQMLTASGFAVLLLNPRGSSGYGQRFSDGSLNDWGGGDYKDLMAGLDHVLAQYSQLDAQRLGVMGGSYGGYMTMWIVTQTPRFKAAVPYAGISNNISFYATSLYQDLIHVEFGGKPWDHYDILWDRSPMKHIKRASTPSLILHGEVDFDVHITQSEEFYTGLEQRGIEAVLVRYPGEGHGATDPKHQKDQAERTVAWFGRFLR